MMRKWFLSLFLFLLVFSAPFLKMVRADEYDELQKQKQQAQEELNQKKIEEEKTKQRQGSVQSNITGTQSSIKSVDGQLKDKEAELKKLESEKGVQQSELQKRVEVRNSLIRLLYKKARVSGFEFFLSSNTFSDFTRAASYYRATTLEKSRQIGDLSSLVIKIKISIKDAADRKAQLERDLKNLNSRKKGLESELGSLNSYLNNLTSQISGLRGTIDNITAKQEQYIREKLAATAQFTSVGEIEQVKQTLPNPPFSPAFAVISIGYPHRVGLNQYGAYGRAKSGQSAYDILKAYYNNIEIKEDYEVPETIEVSGYGRVPFEDLYMKGIAEMPNSWGDKGGLEALKAQAIAARSYALAVTNNGSSSICATQSCQVFIGSNKGGKWEEAVNGTHRDSRRATVMLAGGTPVKAYYSSTFGGYSRLPTDFDVGWNSSFDFLKRIRDADSSLKAFDGPGYGDSPWYYRAWYSAADGHPWLSSDEMRDLLNSSLLPDSENGNLSSPQNGGIGFDEVKNRLRSLGKSPIEDFSSVQPLFSDEGYTSLLRVSVPSGHIDVDGKRFRKIFILRSRGDLALWSSLYDIISR